MRSSTRSGGLKQSPSRQLSLLARFRVSAPSPLVLEPSSTASFRMSRASRAIPEFDDSQAPALGPSASAERGAGDGRGGVRNCGPSPVKGGREGPRKRKKRL